MTLLARRTTAGARARRAKPTVSIRTPDWLTMGAWLAKTKKQRARARNTMWIEEEGKPAYVYRRGKGK